MSSSRIAGPDPRSPEGAPAPGAAGGAAGPRGDPRGDGRGRILMVAPQPFYQDRGTPIAERYVLRALTELGFSVDLLTYPVGSTPEIPGVRYLRVPNPLGFRRVPVGFSLRKVFLDLLIAGRMLRLAATRRYRAVHAAEEAAFLAVALRPLHGAHVIYDMASSLPEQLALLPVFRWRPVQRLCRWTERRLLRSVDTTVASLGLGRIVRSADPEGRVREWLFPAEHGPAGVGERAALRRELELPGGARTVVYTGTFAAYQGIPELLGAVPEVASAHPDAHFVLVGAVDGAEAARIRRAVPGPWRGRLRVLPRQDRHRIGRFLDLADVLVSSRVAGENVPLKVFDYLAAGKPIVATDIPAHRALLDGTLAEIVPPTAAGLAAGLDRLLADAARAEDLAASARRYAGEHLSWEAFLVRMEELVEPLLAPPDRATASGTRPPSGRPSVRPSGRPEGVPPSSG